MKLGHWIALFTLVAAAYVLWEIRDILLMVFAAVVLANSLNLLAQWLQKRLNLQRSLAVLISVLCLLGFAVAFFFLVVPSFGRQLQELFILVPQGIGQVDRGLASLNRAVPPDIRQYLPDFNSLAQQILPLFNRLIGSSFALFSTSLGAALNILLILVLGLMMLINPMPYRNGFTRLFPSFYRRRVDQILTECELSLGNWIVGALISMGVIAVLSTVGLSLIGVPAALANGVLAGLLNFIPNLGPTFSVLPPMAIALLDSPAKSLLVLGLYIGIQQFESNFLTPFVMAQQVHLLPAVTLLAQVFFASIFGFWGLLLSLPLVVVCQIWIRRVLIEDVMDEWNTGPKSRSGNDMVTPIDTSKSLPVVSETVLQPESSSDEPEESIRKDI